MSQGVSLIRVLGMLMAMSLLIVGAFLVYQRGGVLAWVGFLVGVVLLIKTLLRPSKVDLWFSSTVALLWALAWMGVFYYVISTWENGEFVELSIDLPDGTYDARTWILDRPDSLSIYYDAPPIVAVALLSGATFRIIRGGSILSFDQYTVRKEQDVPEVEVNQLFELMSDKYGDDNAATDVFYRLLGRSRDKIVLILDVQM